MNLTIKGDRIDITSGKEVRSLIGEVGMVTEEIRWGRGLKERVLRETTGINCNGNSHKSMR